MPDQKKNNNKKGHAKSMLSNLVSSASAAKKRPRENDEEEGSAADPDTTISGVGPVVNTQQGSNTAVAGPSAGNNSLVPNVPDLVQLPSAFVDLNTSRGGHMLGMSSNRDVQGKDYFVADKNDLVADVSNPDTLGPLGHHWADQHGGQMPRSLVHIRPNNTLAQRIARRNIENQRGRRPLPSLANPKGPGSAPKQDENKDDKSNNKKSGRGGKRRKVERPCGWCGKTGHEVLNCAGPPAADGFIHACGLHNSKAHTYLDYRVAQGWDRVDKWRHLVSERANLPPLAAHDSWEDVAYEYITGSLSRLPVKGDTALPFSVDFVKTIEKQKFDDFDYTRDSAGQLGVEEATSTVDKFMAWCKEVQQQYAARSQPTAPLPPVPEPPKNEVEMADAAAEVAQATTTPLPDVGDDDLIDYSESEYGDDAKSDAGGFRVPTKPKSMANVSDDVM